MTARRLLGALAVVASAAACSAGSHSAPISDITAPRPAFAQIEYRVVNVSSGSSITTWEVLTLSGPFESTDLTYDSPPSTGVAPASGAISTYDGLYDLSGGSLQDISDRAPGPGSGDQAIGAELGDLVQRGLARSAHRTMQVAGRSCQVVALAGPPSGPIAPFSAGDHDDICIDGQGLELSERWTSGGHVIRQRTAVSVSLSAATSKQFAGPPPLSKALSNPTSVLAVHLGEVKSFLMAPPDPVGFTAGEPATIEAASPAEPGSMSSQAEIWTFGREGDFISVEAGQGSVPWPSGGSPTQPVDLPHLGQAVSVLTSDGPQIRVRITGGRWLAVAGSVPLEQLAGYASTLSPAPS